MFFGIKKGMESFWQDGFLVPVTRIELAEQYIINSSLLFCPHKQRKLARPQLQMLIKEGLNFKKGHFTKAPIQLQSQKTVNVAEILAEKTFIDVKGTSKGKGFAGVMKRWNFSGQGASHGNSKSHRKAGSIGQCTSPGRVHPGHKMAGRLGNQSVTALNLRVIKVLPNAILVKGCVPGNKGAMVKIRPAIKKRDHA